MKLVVKAKLSVILIAMIVVGCASAGKLTPQGAVASD